jgi:hypothetical protein
MGVIEDALADKTLDDLRVESSLTTTEPELTEELVDSAIVLLKDVENSNGHIAIAQTLGLTKTQVKSVHTAMLTKIAELNPGEE